MSLRILAPGDEAALERFLARHADTSMFLRSNLRSAGLVDRGAPFQGTYAAAFEDERVVAVVAHAWNGIVLPQAPVRLADVAREAVARSGRAVRGIMGPWGQVLAVRDALGLAARTPALIERELLFGLGLDRLRPPATLRGGGARCLPTRDADLELAARWRAAYRMEVLADTAGPPLDMQSMLEIEDIHRLGRSWLLWVEDAPVAYTAFNAALPDVVQVGGVYTPPDQRGRGWARAAVAGSLLEARAQGVARAVLFTGTDNLAAQRAYGALGFERTGEYGLLFLHD